MASQTVSEARAQLARMAKKNSLKVVSVALPATPILSIGGAWHGDEGAWGLFDRRVARRGQLELLTER